MAGAVSLLALGLFVVAAPQGPRQGPPIAGGQQGQKQALRGEPHAGQIGLAVARAPIAAASAAPPPACSVVEEGVDYQMGLLYRHVDEVASRGACCDLCNADEQCGAWTYGEVSGIPTLTGVCFLRSWGAGGGPRLAAPKAGIVSGLPARTAARAPDAASQQAAAPAPPARQVAAPTRSRSKCPGAVSVPGVGSVPLINAGADTPGSPTGEVEVTGGNTVIPHRGGRTYFGQGCAPGAYSREEYAKVYLLGKTISYTVDLSGTGCGCNAAFYLSSMAASPGKCNDYYCDAMSVCGLACAEIDIQEANQFAWFSTLHAFNPTYGPDKLGRMVGYGGNDKVPTCRYWTGNEYGPGARCIDTSKAFNVSVSFHVNSEGNLRSMEVSLAQGGKPCTVSASVDDYTIAWPNIPVMHGMAELTDALKAGMTPVASYWSSDHMLWLDGPGDDGKGPCARDDAAACPESVKFSGFSVTDIGGR